MLFDMSTEKSVLFDSMSVKVSALLDVNPEKVFVLFSCNSLKVSVLLILRVDLRFGGSFYRQPRFLNR